MTDRCNETSFHISDENMENANHLSTEYASKLWAQTKKAYTNKLIIVKRGELMQYQCLCTVGHVSHVSRRIIQTRVHQKCVRL